MTAAIPVSEFILLGKVREDDCNPKVWYRGRSSQASLKDLVPAKTYCFYVQVRLRGYTSFPSLLFQVDTLEMTAKRSNIRITSFPELPAGWAEVGRSSAQQHVSWNL